MDGLEQLRRKVEDMEGMKGVETVEGMGKMEGMEGMEKMEGMEGLEEALNFIDSRLLQHSDEDEEEKFGKYEIENQVIKCEPEIAMENQVIKGELEIGETEFLDPVSNDLKSEEWPDETTDSLVDSEVAFDAGKLKMETPTYLKIQKEARKAGVVKKQPSSSTSTSTSRQPSKFKAEMLSIQSSSTGVNVEGEDAPSRRNSANLKYSDERFEVRKSNKMCGGTNEVWKEEPQGREMKPEKLTLLLRTASERSSNSRTFKLNVKPGCSLGKVRLNLAGVLKVAAERIVLTTKGRSRCLYDSTLVQEMQDCILTACIL